MKILIFSLIFSVIGFFCIADEIDYEKTILENRIVGIFSQMEKIHLDMNGFLKMMEPF